MTFGKSLALSALILAASQAAMADKKADTAKFKEAYAAYRNAVEVTGDRSVAYDSAKEAALYGRKVLAPDGKSLAVILHNWGKAQLDYGRAEAADTLEEAVAVYEKAYAGDPAALIEPLIDYGSAQRLEENWRGSDRTLVRAEKLAKKLFDDTSPELGRVLVSIGRAKMRTGVSPDAGGFFEQARDIFADADTQYEPMLAMTHFQLGKVQMSKGKFESAVTEFDTALPLLTKYAQTEHLTMITHAMLVQAHEELDQPEQATKHCRAIGQVSKPEADKDYLPIYRKAPVYPAMAQQSGAEGYVIVSLTVDDAGFVQDLKVEERKGSKSFERAALDAASQFRYAPRYKNGQPVATKEVKYRFSFSLT